LKKLRSTIVPSSLGKATGDRDTKEIINWLFLAKTWYLLTLLMLFMIKTYQYK